MPYCGPVRTLLRWQRLRIPDLLGILINAPIGGEKPHPRHTSNALLQPSVLVLEGLIDQPVRLDVRGEVVRHQVVVAVIRDAVAECGEAARVAEHAGLDSLEDLGEVRVELEVAVLVSVAEIFHVLSQVAEEEDVGFADFAGDFDLGKAPCQYSTYHV